MFGCALKVNVNNHFSPGSRYAHQSFGCRAGGLKAASVKKPYLGERSGGVFRYFEFMYSQLAFSVDIRVHRHRVDVLQYQDLDGSSGHGPQRFGMKYINNSWPLQSASHLVPDRSYVLSCPDWTNYSMLPPIDHSTICDFPIIPMHSTRNGDNVAVWPIGSFTDSYQPSKFITGCDRLHWSSLLPDWWGSPELADWPSAKLLLLSRSPHRQSYSSNP